MASWRWRTKEAVNDQLFVIQKRRSDCSSAHHDHPRQMGVALHFAPLGVWILTTHRPPSPLRSSASICGCVSQWHDRFIGINRTQAGLHPCPTCAPYALPLNRPGPATAASTTLVTALVLTLVLTPVVRLFVCLEVASPVPLGKVSRMTSAAIVR